MKQYSSRKRKSTQTHSLSRIENKKRNHLRKVTVSLALDKTIVSELRKQAEDYQVSFNSRVNAILEKYVKFFQQVEKERAAIIPRSLHQFFVNEIDEAKYTDQLKKMGTDVIHAMFVQTGLAATLENLVDFTFKGLCISGGSITNVKQYVDEDGKACLYFAHDYGPKWSKILSAAFAHHIETVLRCHTTTKLFSEGFEIKILEANVA